jgi:dipeptide/tripeptide permease
MSWLDENEKKETDLVYKEKQRVYSQEIVDTSTIKSSGDLEEFSKQQEVSVGEGATQYSDKYPKKVFLIILNEFCERFSYYGLRTILFIYLTTFIKLDDYTSTAIYHSFTVLCYFTPLFGAILADGYIGLYRTILYVSCVYFLGECILTLTSMPPLGAPNMIGPAFALVIIAIGTGG